MTILASCVRMYEVKRNPHSVMVILIHPPKRTVCCTVVGHDIALPSSLSLSHTTYVHLYLLILKAHFFLSQIC